MNNPRNGRFNLLFSKARVAVEHTIGLLKNRFCSLKGLSHQLQKLDDLKAVNRWVIACAVLHNFLSSSRINDEWDDDRLDDEENEDPWADAPEYAQYNMNVGTGMRQAVQKHALRWDRGLV